MSIFDHFGIHVADYAKARDFYAAALAPLGIKLINEYSGEGWNIGGFGKTGGEFWISNTTKPFIGNHVAFAAANRDEVDAFYAAAIAAGGKDNGKPGIREQYHPNYYGAFVFDPDGHNIEAVFHGGT